MVRKVEGKGEVPHQFGRPVGRISKSTKAGTAALENATYKPVKFEAAKKAPDAKEANRVTKVAFRFFQKENKAID
jgi:hypothetical protein